jgi:hypothetical protein
MAARKSTKAPAKSSRKGFAYTTAQLAIIESLGASEIKRGGSGGSNKATDRAKGFVADITASLPAAVQYGPEFKVNRKAVKVHKPPMIPRNNVDTAVSKSTLTKWLREMGGNVQVIPVHQGIVVVEN